ncbi:hypothetical protein [Thioclava sp.]|uniref:hypothetical protein n=1 Tax=Thioclava sp. TaxID=1933450 RepID=UPI003242FB0A
MGKPDFPAFMRDTTAARFCDMKPREFNELVERGAFPPANNLGRWDREELTAIMRGDKPKPNSEFEL